MRYSLLRVRKRIRYHWMQYLLIAAEYAVGIAILIMCLNIFQSSRDSLDEVGKMMGEELVSISCEYKSERLWENGFPISYGNYIEMTEMFPGMKFYFGEYIADYVLIQEEDRIVEKHIFFVNENMADLQMGHGLAGCAYVGTNIYQKLASIVTENSTGNTDSSGNCFYIKGGRLFVTDTVSYPIALLDEGGWISYASGGSISELSKVNYENCIFLPIEAIEELPPKEFIVYSSMLRVGFDTYEDDGDLEILTAFLSESNPDYEFSVSDYYFTTRSLLDALTYEFEIWKWCALVIVALVILTVIGMLSLIYMRRQKAVAVAISFGEKPYMVWVENFLEIVSVLLVGWFAGVIGGEILTSRCVNHYFVIYGYSSFIWWTLLLSIICSVVALIFSNGRVSRQKLPLVMRDL